MRNITASTRYGAIRGRASDGVACFLGVPYAAPPVGERRFALPQPVERWVGERPAIHPGPTAPQLFRTLDVLDGAPLVGTGWRQGEDFLTLDIYAPADITGRAPVLVFIHGGAFVGGCKDAAVTDGSAFARAGIVCVSINYRLGVEGFLPIKGAPTNLGLRDQIAALEWVRDNIAAFGGDPANITVSGESAGAMSVACLMASPLAEGLFRRAIIQSGHGAMVRELFVAQRLTARLARMLKIAPDGAGFRSVSVDKCLQAQERVSRPTARIDLRDALGHEPAFGLSRFLPVYGDDVLPLPPVEALKAGAGRDVELLIGTNLDEMNIYLVPTGVRRRILGPLAIMALGKSHPRPRSVLLDYGLRKKGRRPGDALADAMTDLVFRMPARHFARAHQGRTHFYEFDWHSDAFDGAMGACHALELPFVFNTLASCTGPKGIAGLNPPQALADRVHGIWAAFVRSGELSWPEYDVAGQQVMHLEKGEPLADPSMRAEAWLPER